MDVDRKKRLAADPRFGQWAASEIPKVEAKICPGVPSNTQPHFPRRECQGCEWYSWGVEVPALGKNEHGKLVCTDWTVRM